MKFASHRVFSLNDDDFSVTWQNDELIGAASEASSLGLPAGVIMMFFEIEGHGMFHLKSISEEMFLYRNAEGVEVAIFND